MARPILRVDTSYRNTGNYKHPEDVFNRMFKGFVDGKGIQNAGGFRYKSKLTGLTSLENAAFVLLATNLNEAEWPDRLDIEQGVFTYYGDNRLPGNEIHQTRIGGNRLLREVFSNLHSSKRNGIPPFLCFEHVFDPSASMKFLGLAVPGALGMSSLEDLAAVWRVKGDKRFQNYRATFTILKEDVIAWEWLDDLVQGMAPSESAHCPPSWKRWVSTGIPDALRCEKKQSPRTKTDQLPSTQAESDVLNKLLTLTDREFEFAAKELLLIMDRRFMNLEVTRPSRDGGRDIVGEYRIGHELHEVLLSCYAEAKRWTAGVGVKPLSRLISRIKHRDFGVFITTSFFNEQVQQEIIDDHHPIVLVSGGDIAKLLIKHELAGPEHSRQLSDWIVSIKNLCH